MADPIFDEEVCISSTISLILNESCDIAYLENFDEGVEGSLEMIQKIYEISKNQFPIVEELLKSSIQ